MTLTQTAPAVTISTITGEAFEGHYVDAVNGRPPERIQIELYDHLPDHLAESLRWAYDQKASDQFRETGDYSIPLPPSIRRAGSYCWRVRVQNRIDGAWEGWTSPRSVFLLLATTSPVLTALTPPEGEAYPTLNDLRFEAIYEDAEDDAPLKYWCQVRPHVEGYDWTDESSWRIGTIVSDVPVTGPFEVDTALDGWKLWRVEYFSSGLSNWVTLGGTPTGYKLPGFDDSGWENPGDGTMAWNNQLIGAAVPIAPVHAIDGTTNNGLKWLARKTFTIHGTVDTATLDVSGDDVVQLSLNGTFIGNGNYLVPGVSIPVDPSLFVDGENVLSIYSENGWGGWPYDGYGLPPPWSGGNPTWATARLVGTFTGLPPGITFDILWYAQRRAPLSQRLSIPYGGRGPLGEVVAYPGGPLLASAHRGTPTPATSFQLPSVSPPGDNILLVAFVQNRDGAALILPAGWTQRASVDSTELPNRYFLIDRSISAAAAPYADTVEAATPVRWSAAQLAFMRTGAVVGNAGTASWNGPGPGTGTATIPAITADLASPATAGRVLIAYATCTTFSGGGALVWTFPAGWHVLEHIPVEVDTVSGVVYGFVGDSVVAWKEAVGGETGVTAQLTTTALVMGTNLIVAEYPVDPEPRQNPVTYDWRMWAENVRGEESNIVGGTFDVLYGWDPDPGTPP